MILPSSFADTNNFFGLSVSQSSLKAVSIDKNHQIESYSQFPLEKDILNGQVNNSELFIRGLNTIKTQGKFDSTYVSVVLPEKLAFSKEFTSPKVSISELNEAISWQIEDIFPFSTKDIYYDWKLLSSDEKEIKALIISVQKKIIDSIRKTLADVGLYPISFETAVSSLSRITSIEDKEHVILINMDQQGFSSSLIQKGVSLLTTTHPSNQTQNAIETIQSSIKSLLIYYQDKNKKPLEKYEVLLTGDLAEDNIITSINNQLKINAKLLEIPNITPPFHKAYAAATSHILPPESEKTINLLPQDLNNWYQDQYHQSVQKKTSKYLIAGLATSFLISASSIGFLTLTKNRLSPPQPLPKSNQITNLQNIIKTANQINTLFSQKIGPQEELSLALSLIPSTIKVESINYNASKKQFQLFGISQDRQDLLNFKNSLEESGAFNKVNLPLGALTNKQDSTFSIEFTINSK